MDSLAAAGVAALFSNPSGQRTNYASQVREPYWLGYDPAGPDDQPFFDGYPKERLPTIRPLLDSMIRLDQLGIDFHARAIARCHQHGMEGWISVRMNDVHDVDLPTSPQLDTLLEGAPRLPPRTLSLHPLRSTASSTTPGPRCASTTGCCWRRSSTATIWTAWSSTSCASPTISASGRSWQGARC